IAWAPGWGHGPPAHRWKRTLGAGGAAAGQDRRLPARCTCGLLWRSFSTVLRARRPLRRCPRLSPTPSPHLPAIMANGNDIEQRVKTIIVEKLGVDESDIN